MAVSDFLTAVRTYKPVLKDIGVGKFGAKLVSFPPSHVRGVLKFAQFSTDTTRGVPKSEMHKREVAVYHLDRDVLHFNVVPPAVLVRLDGKPASICEYVEGLLPSQIEPGLFEKDNDGKWKVKLARLFAKVNRDDAVKIVLLDLIVNNTDRHGKNWLVMPLGYRLKAIDNGLTFAPMFRYYRNVIHRYAFLHSLTVPPGVLAHLKSIRRDQIAAALVQYVGKREIEETWRRLQFVIEHADALDFDTLSEGHYEKNDFPSHTRWFRKLVAKPKLLADPMFNGNPPLVPPGIITA